MDKEDSSKDIQKFCKTLDTTYLLSLDKNSLKNLANLVDDSSIPEVYRTKLKVFLTELKIKKYKIKYSNTNKTDYKKIFSEWNVSITGAPKYSILRGISNTNKDALIKIKGFPVYPQFREVSVLRKDKETYQLYLDRMKGLYPHVKKMDLWLSFNACPTEDSIGSNGELIEFLDFGSNNNFTKVLTEKNRNDLLNKKNTFSDIANMFEKKTLCMLKSFWKLENLFEFENTDTFFNLYQGTYSKENKKEKTIKIRNMNFFPSSPVKADKKEVLSYFGINEEYFTFSTPASFKSILQKIIRLRAKKILIPTLDGKSEIEVDGKTYLIYNFISLLFHRGALVPQIQRYVRGLESATKRLGICILEDSSIKNMKDIVSLFCGAYLAQNVKNWFPDKELCIKWTNSLIEAFESNEAFVYESKKFYPFSLSLESSSLQLATILLKDLKSFEGDINFISFLAKNEGTLAKKTTNNVVEVMPLYHAIDQHWLPNFIYYFDLSYLESLDTSKIIEKLYEDTFSLATGFNVRREETIRNENFFKIVREAQKNCMKDILLNYAPKEEEKVIDGEIVQYNFQITPSILSSLVGSIKLENDIIGSLNLKNSYEYNFCRLPSRGNNAKYEIKDVDKKTEEIKEILKRGVPLSASKLFLPYFEGKTLKLEEDEKYYISSSEDKLSLEAASTITFNWRKIDIPKLVDLLNAFDKKYRLKALQYLSVYSKKIKFESFSRHRMINKIFLINVGAFNVLNIISLIFPDILKKTGEIEFEIQNILLLRYMLSEIESVQQFKKEKWGDIQDKKERQLWPHQNYALEEIESSKNKGHFLFLNVGMGKTLIVMKYLQHLFEQNQLPKYVIYTLPSSAIASVTKEIEAFGFEVNVCIPIKSRGNKKTIEKYKVNIIEHDHLRRMSDELYENIVNSIFIIDEVHKCLSDSQRTSIALDLAYSCVNFVALTGTPIIDNKVYKLEQWLKLICDFEINKDTFWVAINSMIHSNTQTDVKVIRKTIYTELNDEEEKEYRKLVKEKLGGNNSNMTMSDLQEAVKICYKACTRKMVKLCKKYYKDGILLVAKDIKHQDKLYEKIKKELPDVKIFRITKENTINLTFDTVEKKEVDDYKIVITTIRKSEGYNCTYLQRMITSVYPSNNATRVQIEGRINRIGQRKSKVYIHTVSAKILNNILENHTSAQNLDSALRAMI